MSKNQLVNTHLRLVSGTIIFGLLCFIFFGCASASKNVSQKEPASVQPQQSMKHPVASDVNHQKENTGSLWRDDGIFSDLFILPKARQVGDIVTVKIVESSSATNEANTLTERDSSLVAKIDSFLGLEQRWINPNHPDYRADKNFNPFGEIGGGMTSEFDGSGATSRRGDLTAFMTARIVSITQNGTLYIEGSREVEVNNEKQLIALSGYIRPRDIASDNVIFSTFISDAKITYTGAGVVNDRQRPGWMSNFMNRIWPF